MMAMVASGMSNYELNLRIDESFQDSIAEKQLRKVVGETLAAHGVDSPVELGLVIADDRVVQELNRSYRGLDATTDVLAFALWEESQDFATPPNGIVHLGEVFISCPQAERQAKEQGHPLERELALLAIHGVLHLLGYDHEDPDEEQKMRAMEEKILALIAEELE
jgi:probable rRNA maturation factor